jgi:hypothetical protein
MHRIRIGVLALIAVFLTASGAPAQQQANRAADKGKKPPKQTHDTGVDDPVVAPDAKLGERDAAGINIFQRADGVFVAQLDESFHDALVATKKADGSIGYTCLHGLPAAVHHVNEPPQPVAPTQVLEEK